MDLTEQLRVLAGGPRRPGEARAGHCGSRLSRAGGRRRAALKESLEAAAIPHWCDEAILAALLGITAEESAVRLARLRRLSVVEPFPRAAATQ